MVVGDDGRRVLVRGDEEFGGVWGGGGGGEGAELAQVVLLVGDGSGVLVVIRVLVGVVIVARINPPFILTLKLIFLLLLLLHVQILLVVAHLDHVEHFVVGRDSGGMDG